MTQKGNFSILLIVVVIIVSIIGIGFYRQSINTDNRSQNIDHTSQIDNRNWTKYTSNDSLFEFSYPSDKWAFKELVNESNYGKSYQKIYGDLKNNLEDNQSMDASFVIVSPSMYSSGRWETVTQEEFYNIESKGRTVGEFGGGVSMVYLKPEKLLFGANNFIKQESYTSPNQGDGINYNLHFLEYSILVDGKILTIRLTEDVTNPNNKQAIQEFEDILATLTISKSI